MDRIPNESHLLDSDVGYEVLDAIAQANVDLKTVSLDELNQMVVQFSTHRRRGAIAQLIRDRKRPMVEKSSDDHSEPFVVWRRDGCRTRTFWETIGFA